MKRIFLHIGFWIVYLFQDVMLIFLLDATRLQQFSVNERLAIAIENCLVCLIPKLLFTYFLLYVVLEKAIKEGIQTKSILYSLAVLTGSVFLYKVLVLYFIDPVIYKWSIVPLPYFNLLSFLVISIDVCFVTGIAIIIKQFRLQSAAKELERALIREKLETELKFLRNQTNPHFLFNTLNNIYALARKKSDDTHEVVMKLSKLLRFMLYETKRPFVKIEEEIRILDDYIDLERIRYNGNLTINFLREIDNENEKISPLLLLPFVENAFKHGVSESRSPSYVDIDMKLQNGVLDFSVENTKENMGKNNGNENIGLSNVKRQLELMYKDYDMQMLNEPTLFKVILTINLKSHAKI